MAGLGLTVGLAALGRTVLPRVGIAAIGRILVGGVPIRCFLVRRILIRFAVRLFSRLFAASIFRFAVSRPLIFARRCLAAIIFVGWLGFARLRFARAVAIFRRVFAIRPLAGFGFRRLSLALMPGSAESSPPASPSSDGLPDLSPFGDPFSGLPF